MRKMWNPNSIDLKMLVEEKVIVPDGVYSRTEASEKLGMAENVFAREIKYNCLFIAFGKTVTTGKFVLYPGSELIAQIERLKNPIATGDLIYSLSHDSDAEFKEKHNGISKATVLKSGNYLNGWGWCGKDWNVPETMLKDHKTQSNLEE